MRLEQAGQHLMRKDHWRIGLLNPLCVVEQIKVLKAVIEQRLHLTNGNEDLLKLLARRVPTFGQFGPEGMDRYRQHVAHTQLAF